MEKITGQRNATIYAYEGYTYFLDKDYVYRCTKRTAKISKCHATAHYNECGDIVIRGVHMDVAEPNVVQMSIMKEKMKELVRENHVDPLLNIFNDVCKE